MHLAASGALTLTLTLGGLLATPVAAQAKIPVIGEIPVVGEAVEGIGAVGEAVLNPAEAVLSALLKVLQAIFGGVEAKLITGVINGLLTIPNFDSGHVAGLEHTTVAISAGMLSAVLTLSILRYYIAGLTDSGSGGFEALQGLVRVTGAVGFIILWPGIFSELTAIPSAFNHALLGSTSVQHNVALLFDAALTLGTGAFAIDTGLGLIFVILIGFISAIVFLALLWMKVLLSVMLMFLYVSMPLCSVLWPVPELSWLAVSAMKALSVAVMVPSVWAILFSLSSAVNADVLTFAPSHSVIDTVIIRPLAGITLMLLCITIPRFLMRTAMIGPQGQPGGWRVWRTVTFGMFAARAAAGAGQAVATAAVEGHAGAARMIDSLPTPIRPPSEPGAGSLASRIVFGRSGFTEDTEGNGARGNGGQGGSPAKAGGEQDSTVPANSENQAQPGADGAKEAFGRKEAAFKVPGIERPQLNRTVENEAWQTMQGGARMAPPTAADVKAAMGQFSPETQKGIAAFQTANPDRMRQFAANHVGAANLSADQRDALLTLGSAPRGAVTSGITQAIASLDSPPATPTPTTTKADATPGQTQAPGSGSAGAKDTPSSGPKEAPEVHDPAPTASGGTPSTGARSLGADLREQPAPAGKDPNSQSGSELADPEPFLD